MSTLVFAGKTHRVWLALSKSAVCSIYYYSSFVIRSSTGRDNIEGLQEVELSIISNLTALAVLDFDFPAMKSSIMPLKLIMSDRSEAKEMVQTSWAPA